MRANEARYFMNKYKHEFEGMEIPKELEEKFKFARQKSKLAGTIRGSFFVIIKEY